MKREGESFSGVVNRLRAREESLLDILDLYPDLHGLAEFEDAILSNRRSTKDNSEKINHELSCLLKDT